MIITGITTYCHPLPHDVCAADSNKRNDTSLLCAVRDKGRRSRARTTFASIFSHWLLSSKRASRTSLLNLSLSCRQFREAYRTAHEQKGEVQEERLAGIRPEPLRDLRLARARGSEAFCVATESAYRQQKTATFRLLHLPPSFPPSMPPDAQYDSFCFSRGLVP